MSVKSKVLAACATLTLVSGVGAAGAITAGTASAATPSCGSSCIDVFSNQFGIHGDPAYVVDVLKQGEKIGQPIILFRQANFDPAEDFTAAFQGTVADFFAAGMVSSAVALHYGCVGVLLGGWAPAGSCLDNGGVFPNDPAFESEYAPFGVESGLCVGVAATAFSGEGVTLQPCGVSSKTVWIIDQADASTGPINVLVTEYVPLINGSDTNFSQPFVLTYPANGFPTDKPRPQFTVTNLTGFSNPSTGDPEGVETNQMFGADTGTLP